MPPDSSPENAERKERFLALLDPAYERLERFCFALERDRDAAYDLIGETILRAWQNFHRLRDPDAFPGWLFTTASRLAARRRLRARLFGFYDEKAAMQLRSLASPPDESADVAPLYDALATLPRKQREAIVLFDINGLTLKEIADIQGGTVAALKVRLHRGRKRLAEILRADYSEEREGQPQPPEEEAEKEKKRRHRNNPDIKSRTTLP